MSRRDAKAQSMLILHMAILTVCLNPTLQKTLSFPEVVQPGEVNRTDNHRLDASGKGINVTRVLTQLGKDAVHLTQLGSELRSLFLSFCQKDDLLVEWVESNSLIRFCYTVIYKKNVTELVEESEPVGEGTEQRLLEKFNFMLGKKDYSTLIISGTKAAGFSDAIIPAMVLMAKEKGLRIILDIKGKDLTASLQYQPDVIKPNLLEFTNTFGIGASEDADIKTAMFNISRKYGSRVVLTDGNRKLRAVEGNNYFEVDIDSSPNVVNTIGCGDAFTAGLASALEDGAGFRDAIAEGNRCGALNAGLMRPGVICNTNYTN